MRFQWYTTTLCLRVELSFFVCEKASCQCLGRKYSPTQVVCMKRMQWRGYGGRCGWIKGENGMVEHPEISKSRKPYPLQGRKARETAFVSRAHWELESCRPQLDRMLLARDEERKRGRSEKSADKQALLSLSSLEPNHKSAVCECGWFAHCSWGTEQDRERRLRRTSAGSIALWR